MRKRRYPKTLKMYYPVYQYRDLKNVPKQKNIDFAPYFEEFLNKNNYKMFEVGCAIGNFLANDPKNIIGIDINKNSLKIARKRGFNVICANISLRTAILLSRILYKIGIYKYKWTISLRARKEGDNNK